MLLDGDPVSNIEALGRVDLADEGRANRVSEWPEWPTAPMKVEGTGSPQPGRRDSGCHGHGAVEALVVKPVDREVECELSEEQERASASG